MKKLLIGVLALILLTNVVLAQGVSVSLEKTRFYSGEEIAVHVVLENTGTDVASLELDLGISHEEDLYSFETISETVILKGSESRELTYKFKVEDFATPGKYTVEAVLWKDAQKVSSDTESIEISGTDMTFDFALDSYEEGMTKKSNIFLRGEKVYLDYTSGISGVSIDATIIYPDKTEKEITLPASITAEQTGTYEVVIVASQKGYETIRRTKQFAVVSDKQAVINSVSECNSNKVCETGESYKTCPQDCGPNILIRYPKTSIIILIIVLVLIIRYLLKEKKR